MKTLYRIVLDSVEIGTTSLEHADPPMGVVYGEINFHNISSPFAYLEKYCSENKIKLNECNYADNYISTQFIPNLKVYNENEVEIIGTIGINIDGMDKFDFQINILGVEYPFYETEFPHHVYNYKNHFDSNLIYIQFKIPNSQNKVKDKKGISYFLLLCAKLFISKANPKYENNLDQVMYWLLEIDINTGIPKREIGLNIDKKPIVKMPFNNEYGYWTDNNLTLNDFNEQFQTSTINVDEFENKWNQIENY